MQLFLLFILILQPFLRASSEINGHVDSEDLGISALFTEELVYEWELRYDSMSPGNSKEAEESCSVKFAEAEESCSVKLAEAEESCSVKFAEAEEPCSVKSAVAEEPSSTESFKTGGQNWEPLELPTITKEWIEAELIPLFKSGQMISKELIQKIIQEVTGKFKYERIVEDVSVPPEGKVIVVGDIHGQFESTLTIFEDFGYPSPDLIYIFNGDIVDRGDKSLECLLMIFAYKIALPYWFNVTRGNHESRTVSKETFYEDCQCKLSDYPEAFDHFQEAFEFIPYGYVVRKHFFVIHGGLCAGMKVSKLKVLSRSTSSYKNNYCLYSMLWNDPADPCESVNANGLALSPRGDLCRRFHQKITFDFLHRNKLEMLVRSHQAVEKGAQMDHLNRCLTVFSAPNYRQRGNRGAVLVISEDNYMLKQMRA